MAPILGYWKMRGHAQPIRLLLAHVGQEFEDKFYHFGPAPDFSKAEWLADKPNLGLELPNLPYYIDGDLKITQSGAILRYLADKHDLNPTNAEQKRRVFEVEYQIDDFRMALAYTTIDKDFDKAREDYGKTISGELKLYSNFLGKENWLAGDKLTYVDFLFYEALQWHHEYKPRCLDEFANVKDYVARFEALPNVSKYMKSDKFLQRPLLGAMTQWGNV